MNGKTKPARWLTPRKGWRAVSSAAAQGEYVACRQVGLEFTAHGDAWHWYDPDEGVAYSRVRTDRGLEDVVLTTVTTGIGWIDEAAAAIKRAASA